MSDAPVVTFNPWEPTPRFHLRGQFEHVREGIERWTTTKTLCGLLIGYTHFIDTTDRDGKWHSHTIESECRGTDLRRDHAMEIGVMCRSCERIEAKR